MSFLWPSALLLLALLPLAALGYLALERRRRARLAGLGTMGRVTGGPVAGQPSGLRPRIRRWLPAVLILAGLGSLVVALARPQAVIGVPRQEGIVVLAFDVSGSMAAEDMTPSRMEAAKAAAAAFVERQPPGVVVGVVAFSDSGLSVQVPTRDQALVLAAIDRLHPERGTSITHGIAAALDAIVATEEGETQGYYTNRSPGPEPERSPVPAGSHRSAVVVLLTDGEDTGGADPLAGAQAAADQGIRVHTVGIGSRDGTTIEVEGYRIHTRLDTGTLEAIAAVTGGTYHHAQTSADLRGIYDTLETRLSIRTEPTEVTAIVAALALAFLTLGGLTGLVWLGRLP